MCLPHFSVRFLMDWILTDTASALKEIRRALEKKETEKDGCLEWRWMNGQASFRRRADDCTAFGHAPVNAAIVSGEAEYEYAVAQPKDGGRGKPLILFLHGFGERGGDPKAILCYGPFCYLARGGEIPAVIVAPHLEENRHWVEDETGEASNAETDRLARFLRQMQARYQPDPEKISCTGLSMGGRGTYRLSCALPGAFSAAVVCCGRAGEEGQILEPLENMAHQRIWLFHGMQDRVVPPQRAAEALEALLRLRPEGCFRLTLYPGVGHACYEKAYLNGDVYRWLTT